jgi:hypothetical protein
MDLLLVSRGDDELGGLFQSGKKAISIHGAARENGEG